MDGWQAGDSPSVLSFDALIARGHARMTGEWGAGREFREAARRVRPWTRSPPSSTPRARPASRKA